MHLIIMLDLKNKKDEDRLNPVFKILKNYESLIIAKSYDGIVPAWLLR